jgi:hypothetical protein
VPSPRVRRWHRDPRYRLSTGTSSPWPAPVQARTPVQSIWRITGGLAAKVSCDGWGSLGGCRRATPRLPQGSRADPAATGRCGRGQHRRDPGSGATPDGRPAGGLGAAAGQRPSPEPAPSRGTGAGGAEGLCGWAGTTPIAQPGRARAATGVAWRGGSDWRPNAARGSWVAGAIPGIRIAPDGDYRRALGRCRTCPGGVRPGRG